MYSRGMYVGPPGGVNISRCIAASISRATLTKNSSQMRRGLTCSSAASKGSSDPSPSTQRLIDSSRPTLFWFPLRKYLATPDALSRISDNAGSPSRDRRSSGHPSLDHAPAPAPRTSCCWRSVCAPANLVQPVRCDHSPGLGQNAS